MRRRQNFLKVLACPPHEHWGRPVALARLVRFANRLNCYGVELKKFSVRAKVGTLKTELTYEEC